MPRNFGVRQSAHDFWNDPEDEHDPKWPFVVIGAAVLAIIAVGIFMP